MKTNPQILAKPHKTESELLDEEAKLHGRLARVKSQLAALKASTEPRPIKKIEVDDLDDEALACLDSAGVRATRGAK